MNIPPIVECSWGCDPCLEDLVQIFNSSGVDINTQYPPIGYTLCHYAAAGDWNEIGDGRFSFLLSKLPNVEIRAWPQSDWFLGWDWTVLMVACMHGTLDKVQLLVEYGSCVNAVDSLGRSALMISQYGFDPEGKTSLLLAAGANEHTVDHMGLSLTDHKNKIAYESAI